MVSNHRMKPAKPPSDPTDAWLVEMIRRTGEMRRADQRRPLYSEEEDFENGDLYGPPKPYCAYDAFPMLDTRDGTHWFALCWPDLKGRHVVRPPLRGLVEDVFQKAHSEVPK